MSIQVQIATWVQHGDLKYLLPYRRTGVPQRHVFVSNQIWELVETGPWLNARLEGRAATLRQDFDRFILGKLLTARMNPTHKQSVNVAILDPMHEGIWEIRGVTPEPQLRIFGAFAEKDVFIALNWAQRDWLADDKTRWRYAIQSCKTAWTHFFPVNRPLASNNIHDFISKNVVVL